MSVAIYREPIRTRLDEYVQRVREALERLFWQSVDQVDVDRAKLVRAAVCDDTKGLFDALYLVDSALHSGIQVLYPETRSVEASIGQRGDISVAYPPGIE